MNTHSYWTSYAPSYLMQWSRNESRKILHQIEQSYICNTINTFATKKEKRTYIDLGCGPGRIIDMITTFDKTYTSITGIDSNPSMITRSKQRFYKNKNIHIYKTDIVTAKPNDTADIITCIRVLKYIPERASIFRHITTMLNPHGLFIFTVTNRHSIAFFDILKINHYKDTLEEIHQHLTKSGYELINAHGVQRFPECIYTVASLLHIAPQLYHLEEVLSTLIGTTRLARTLYITARKV